MTQEVDKKTHPLHAMRSGIHVARHPGRVVSKRIQKRLQKRGFRHRLFDFVGVAIIGIAIVVGIFLIVRADPGRRIAFSAVVAPAEIVSGDASTLSIGYTNKSKRTLRDVTLTLSYPPYFALQDVDNPTFEPTTNTIHVGELAPGANGLVKIRGVMFGDIGGTQEFASTLSYNWNKARSGTREQTYTFQPARSALVIETQLPDQLVSGQRLAGDITLQNTGPVTFPEAAIHAIFPDGFRLSETSQAQRDDETWIIPSIEPGETLTIRYAGSLALGDDETATFQFEPSFVFGSERFTQDILTETVATLPPPITVSLDTNPPKQPGGTIPATVRWSDQTNLAVSDVRVFVDGATNTPEWFIDTPVIANERSVSLIPAAQGTNRTATFLPVIEFTLDGTGDRISVVGEPSEQKLSTPIQLDTFARYFTSAGDQLGRGPLPPRVGEATTYWVFLNVRGTFNDLKNITLTANLPSNVRWIDRQSVTRGSGVTYNAALHSISWDMKNLPATVSSGRVAAASFALEITPTTAQIGSIASLLQNVSIQGTDTWTGQTVRSSAGAVTTRVTEDDGTVR